MLPLKHLRKRKKHKTQKKASYDLLDFLVYFISFAGPIMTIPQIYDIWVRRDLSVNEITWMSYLVSAVIWFVYGIVHQEKPIVFSNFLWILAQGMVVLGVVVLR